jgi:crotonobetainyl-CoA:carnitine CoA-transferase CaiB-like acyl-CoA transferase
MAGVLDGIRIIDWTQWQMGTVPTAMMAELGAEIIHVEARLTGDHGRYLKVSGTGDLPQGKTAYFETNNRGKKSLTVDLNKPAGREIIYRLVKKSDVFVHNFRQGVPEKLQMDYETICQHNPQIVYIAASGYGPRGPEAKEPAFDMIGLARSGISSLFSYEGDPNLPFHGGIADQAGAIMVAYGILAGLLAKIRLGIGQKVDVSHLGSMMALQGLNIGMGLLVNPEGPAGPLPPKPTRKNTANPLWNYYLCQDGRWLCLGMLQPDVKWSIVCQALGIEHLEHDPKYENAEVRRVNSASLIAIMDEIFITKTTDEWMQHLKATGDIICTPVQTLYDLRKDPQVLANNYLVELEHETLGKVKVRNCPIEMSKTPAKVKVEAPELGQHTEEILSETLGYSWEEIGKLHEQEVI